MKQTFTALACPCLRQANPQQRQAPRTNTILAFFTLAILALAACKKTDLPPNGTQAPPPKATPNFIGGIDLSNPIFVQNRPNPDAPLPEKAAAYRNTARLPDEDYSDELPVILGAQLQNPYTRDNMATAYNVLYGTQYAAADLPITHYYIQFTPANSEQLAQLDEETELDLSTHPLDYELLQDGDYYAAPGKTPNDIPELYTVVAADDVIPGFAPHTILAALHIPPNDDLLLEEIAESQAAGAVYYRTTERDHAYLNRSDVDVQRVELPDCLNEGVNSLDYNPWAYDPCYGGGNATEGSPGANPCGGATLVCTESRRPKGRLRYWDTQLGGSGRCVPLQTVKVIGKNWFKGVAPRHHMYTDANGLFVHNKKFKRVKVNVHFRNAGISIRPLRIAKWLRLSIFTLKSRLGHYSSCDMNTIDRLYRRPADKQSREMEYWTASHVLHGFDEFKAQSEADELKPLNGWRLKYYIQRDHIARTRGAESNIYMKSYLHNQQGFADVAISVTKIVNYSLKAIAGDAWNLVPAAAELLRQVLGSQQPDIVLMHNTYPGDAENSLENMTSSELCKEIYSSFTRASLIKNSGSKAVKAYMKKKDKLIQAAISLMGTAISATYANWNLEDFIKKFDMSNPTMNGMGGVGMLNAVGSYATMQAAVQTWLGFAQVTEDVISEQFFEIADGFGEYYGHKLADRKYRLEADAFYNEKRLLVSSGNGTSSHYKYLEDWEADVDIDELARLRVGFFNDLEDDIQDEVKNQPDRSLNKIDSVSNIKPKDMFYCIINDGQANPEAATWARLKQNLISKFGSQTNQINQLCIPYRIP
jgi:hypothetical protein